MSSTSRYDALICKFSIIPSSSLTHPPSKYHEAIPKLWTAFSFYPFLSFPFLHRRLYAHQAAIWYEAILIYILLLNDEYSDLLVDVKTMLHKAFRSLIACNACFCYTNQSIDLNSTSLTLEVYSSNVCLPCTIRKCFWWFASIQFPVPKHLLCIMGSSL